MSGNQYKIEVLYIAGGGHSGSTILSLILGTAPEIYTAGELKFYNEHKDEEHHNWEYMENKCICGKNANDCPFWVGVEDRAGLEIKIFHYMKLWTKIITLFKILWPFYHVKKSVSAEDDFRLIESVYLEARKKKPSTRYILDSSKSVARMMHLDSHPNLDVKVIFLVRDGRGYLNSYTKAYKGGYFRWMAQWVVNNYLTLAYLKKAKKDYYFLSYDALCKQPEKEFGELDKKFNIHVPDNYTQMVHDTEFHIRAGNPTKSFLAEFSGLKLDDRWRHEIPKAKRFLATLILHFFNRKWVYNR